MRAEQQKQLSLRIRDSTVITNSPGLSLVMRGNQRLMSYDADEQKSGHFSEDDVAPADSYDEFVDQLMMKMELLMDLRIPTTGNRFDLKGDMVNETGEANAGDTNDALVDSQVEKEDTSDAHTNANQTQPNFATMTSDYQTVMRKLRIAHASELPESTSSIMTVSLFKFLTLFVPIGTGDLRRALATREENAKTLAGALEDAAMTLQRIDDFPQAERLLVLGVCDSLTRSRSGRIEDCFLRDYFHGCEGCGSEGLAMCARSLKRYVECLMKECERCVHCLHWRLVAAIVYVLATLPSLQTPFLTLDCDYLGFYRRLSELLRNWFGSILSEKDVLISPGPFLDSLCETVLPADSVDARVVIRAMKNTGFTPYTGGKQLLQGVAPTCVLVIANCLRLGLQITVVSQFKDYRSRCATSSALRSDNLYFWSITETCCLCDRMSEPYLEASYRMLTRYCEYVQELVEAFSRRAAAWHPFAHTLYSSVDSSINPFCCVRPVGDEKETSKATLRGDLLLSAGEALLTSHISLFVFLSRTKLGTFMSDLLLQPGVCSIFALSPRLQRQLMVLMQEILPRHPLVPELPGMQEELRLESSAASKQLFVYYLLHLASHADSCVGALVNEKSPCAICCPLRHAMYYLTEKNDNFSGIVDRYSSPTTCRQLIRPEGHAASYCLCEIMEEAVYLLRILGNAASWSETVGTVCSRAMQTSMRMREDKTVPQMAHPHLIHTVYSSTFISVTRVFGGLIPRLYPGCRVRLASTQLHPSTPSFLQFTHPTSLGFCIQTDRMTAEPLVLVDRLDIPSHICLLNLEVVDRVDPPRSDGVCDPLFDAVVKTMATLKFNPDLTKQPGKTMAYFNSDGAVCGVHELADVLGYICGVRCLQHLSLQHPALLKRLSASFVHSLMHLAVQSQACNRFVGLHMMKQYFNWFMEYLVNTFPGSPRFLPLTMQEGEVKEFGWEKEERRRGNEIEGRVSLDDRRMRGAVTISGITGYDPMICYKVYRVGFLAGGDV